MGHSAESKLGSVDLYPVSINLDCYVSMADILRPKKKAKKQDLSTITLGYLHSKGEKYESKTYEKNKNSI